MADAEIGLVGLGTMGAALALNIAENGFRIAVQNRRFSVTERFVSEAGSLADRITGTETLEDLVAALRSPRAVILMVPAGDPVDQQIEILRGLLDKGDIVIDAGNANFHDTIRRDAAAREAGLLHLGLGVSGGEDGARHGPSMMAGGPEAAWQAVEPILTAIAADHRGTPCATRFGPAGSGHFVKTVHNGIEYADMQMIAEIYGILRDGQGADAARVSNLFGAWNEGPLRSYLVEITAKVAGTDDPGTGKPLIDMILDKAGQKGTGRWTAIEAQHLGAPIPVIEAAVSARNLSALSEIRAKGEDRFGAAPQRIDPLPDDTLEQALIAGKILCYAQGFDLLYMAGQEHGWPLDLPAVARVWRAGCIIRSAMLDDMASALTDAPEANLIFAPGFAEHLERCAPALRETVATALAHGLPVPALSAALTYFDTMRTARGTANMLQAQRDYFGRHGFARIDAGGADHHGPWAE